MKQLEFVGRAELGMKSGFKSTLRLDLDLDHRHRMTLAGRVHLHDLALNQSERRC